jgi:hypothetical protein
MSTVTPALVPAKAAKPAKVEKTKLDITGNVRAIRAVILLTNARKLKAKAEARSEKAQAILDEIANGKQVLVKDGIPVASRQDRQRSGYSKAVLLARFPDAEKAAKYSTDYHFWDAVKS